MQVVCRPESNRAKPDYNRFALTRILGFVSSLNRFHHVNVRCILQVVEGVRLHGTSWASVKTAFSLQLARRSHINIKDKWRWVSRVPFSFQYITACLMVFFPNKWVAA